MDELHPDPKWLRLECIRQAFHIAHESGNPEIAEVLAIAAHLWRFVEHGEPTVPNKLRVA